MATRYVAMGSSFAAGPRIGRRAAGSPRKAGRSALNYAHLLAARHGLDLVDVTWSGATAAELLNGQEGAGPPQIEAVTPETELVTLTCGGNDLGYIGRLMMSSLPIRLPGVRAELAEITSLYAPRLALLPATLDRLLAEIRRRAPAARIMLIDYLTVLPPAGTPTGRLPAEVAAWGRDVAADLSAALAAAAARQECRFVAAGAASLDHHAWSADPWTSRWTLLGAPFHPNRRGMEAVADLVTL